ncbi:unnamed protein product, partial [Ixodes persulcatus]
EQSNEPEETPPARRERPTPAGGGLATPRAAEGIQIAAIIYIRLIYSVRGSRVPISRRPSRCLSPPSPFRAFPPWAFLLSFSLSRCVQRAALCEKRV